MFALVDRNRSFEITVAVLRGSGSVYHSLWTSLMEITIEGFILFTESVQSSEEHDV